MLGAVGAVGAVGAGCWGDAAAVPRASHAGTGLTEGAMFAQSGKAEFTDITFNGRCLPPQALLPLLPDATPGLALRHEACRQARGGGLQGGWTSPSWALASWPQGSRKAAADP